MNTKSKFKSKIRINSNVPQCKKCRSKYQHQSTKYEIQVQFNFSRTKPNYFRIVQTKSKQIYFTNRNYSKSKQVYFTTNKFKYQYYLKKEFQTIFNQQLLKINLRNQIKLNISMNPSYFQTSIN